MDGTRTDRAGERRFEASRAHRERALRHLAFGVSSTPRSIATGTGSWLARGSSTSTGTPMSTTAWATAR